MTSYNRASWRMVIKYDSNIIHDDGSVPEIELGRVPAADPVVGAEVPLVHPVVVGGGAVPLGVDEHVVTGLSIETRWNRLSQG
jgi:hypothetical protein